MPIYRLDLAYDGSGFRGYARQRSQRTIQGELEASLQKLLGSIPETVVAGRTDAGVHARGQVVSLSLDDVVDTAEMARSLNGMLGPEIAVNHIELVEESFHARFSAKWRRYRYQFDCGQAPDPMCRLYAWHVGPSLDWHRIVAATVSILGEHDFSSFCRTVEGRSSVRTVDEARWEEDGDFWHFWIRANSFCHQMVRSLVGHLYDLGRGFADPDSTEEVIEARDRSRVATVAPAHGLVLWEVGY
ncbi:MAG: tRNA pseudouridine(38-40) synthase TruA [Acidimicrobiia bacterium]